MDTPDWRTFNAGTRIRVALWLHSEIGAGGTFTKADLRNAFPGVEQIDRRMRDLRPEGWIIATYQEDRSLAADELRLVEEGGAVWERGYRSRQPRAVSAKERQETMLADGFSCVLCGIAGGETYPDDALRIAKLSVIRRPIAGRRARELSTLCDRCLAGGPQEKPDDLASEIATLAPDQQRRLAEWVRLGGRPRTKEEELWGRYRRLPEAERKRVEALLRD